MSLKLHYLRSHFGYLRIDSEDVSEEQGKRFHQDMFRGVDKFIELLQRERETT